MRKNLKAKALVYPQPVFIIATYNEDGSTDAMNAAWGCVADINKVAIYMAKNHKTYENICNTQAFTVSMATSKYVKQADYVGVVSANDELHKFDNTGWHSIKSECINAPIIEELPLTLECKFESFDEESELLIGEVVNVSVDESILDENGKVDVYKLDPITYDTVNHTYITLGKKVGNAFKDGIVFKKCLTTKIEIVNDNSDIV